MNRRTFLASLPFLPSAAKAVVSSPPQSFTMLETPWVTKGLTPTEFENLSNKEIDLARVILMRAARSGRGSRCVPH